MANEEVRYFVGDIYADDIGIGFLASDRSGSNADPTIDEVTARAIVAAAGVGPEATLATANLFEISAEEIALYRDTEMSIPGLSEGLTIWQVKR